MNNPTFKIFPSTPAILSHDGLEIVGLKEETLSQVLQQYLQGWEDEAAQWPPRLEPAPMWDSGAAKARTLATSLQC